MKSAANIAVLATFVFSLLTIKLSAQELVVDLKELGTLIRTWEDVHNSKSLKAFQKMYADEVIFYSETLPKSNCISIKFKRLNSKRYFHLEIITQPTIVVYSSEIIKVGFVKKVTSGETVTNYDSYLLVKKVADSYQVVGESDLTTDGNKNFSPDLGTELKRSLIAKEFTSTKRDTSAVAKNKPTTSTPSKIDFNPMLNIAIGTAALFLLGFVVYKRQMISRKRISTPDIQSSVISPTQSNSNPLEQPEKSKWVHAPKNQYSPPPTWKEKTDFKKDGDTFEAFVVERFRHKCFTLIDQRSDKVTNGIYPKSNTYPDLEIEFSFADLREVFAVECKFRRKLYSEIFKLKDGQFDNYNNFSKSKGIPVYVVLGLGGRPDKPTDLFTIPLSAFNKDGSIKYVGICDYYDDPKYKFFYDPKTKGLRYSRKFR